MAAYRSKLKINIKLQMHIVLHILVIWFKQTIIHVFWSKASLVNNLKTYCLNFLIDIKIALPDFGFSTL